jgi:hypothetical protein
VLFSDNFNTNSSGSWTVNAAPAANAAMQQANFAFDYSAFGIPAAPGSADTLGLRLRANLPIVGGVEVTTRPAGVLSGLSLSPTGKNFGTNYRMSFYAWSNFIGGPNAQGLADNANSEGGTANVLFAVGTTGTVPLVVGNTGLVSGASMDAIAFATTGDGGIGSDYRVYPASGTIVPGTNGTVYAAGAVNGTANTTQFYVDNFPSQTAPAIQQTISANEYGGDAANTQLGMTQAGSFGFKWQKVVITKNNNIVTWDVNDVRIATFDASSTTLGGNNIALGVSDVNTTTARHPSLVFTVFDNLEVTDIAGTLAGNFDNDTNVDGDDLTQWKGDFGVDNGSDADGDGDSDGADFLAWQRNFGASTTAIAAPEPAALAVAGLGAVVLAGWRRSSKRVGR